MLRAGLVGILLFFLFFANVAVCVPALSAPVSLGRSLESDGTQRSNIVTNRPINEVLYSRAEELAYGTANGWGQCHERLSLRSFEDDDVVVLYRRNIFTKIKEGFQKLGHGIKHVFQKIGTGIKHVAQKIGHGIVHAAKAVGHFVKTTGAKIAKFGLKVVSTVASVASKVVQFVPLVGPAASAALKVGATATNVASDAIHANLGKKLEKGMKVMNIIQDPLGAAASAAVHKVASKPHH